MGAAKAMKATKTPRAMKTTMKGRKDKTSGGLRKVDLTKNGQGKVVSRKMSARGKRAWANSKLRAWTDACKKARKALGLEGFVAVGGQSAAGKALYAKVKALL